MKGTTQIEKYKRYVKDLRERANLLELVSIYGFSPNNSGYICCPFHYEKTPSLKVWKDHFKCFGCGEYGDTIAFVQKLDELSFVEAMNKINADLHLGLPLNEKISLRNDRAAQKAQAQRKAEKDEAAHDKEIQFNLEDLWILADIIIARQPVPDNDYVARLYRFRDYIGYLLDCGERRGEDFELPICFAGFTGI